MAQTGLDTPAEIVAVMEEVFHLSDRAEEYMYLICINTGCKPICLFEMSHSTHDSALVGIREIIDFLQRLEGCPDD